MKFNIKEFIYASFFLALGLVLPSIFHAFGMGKIFLPMHIPVLLAGLFLGTRYGLIVGVLTPLLSSVLTGMPPIYPVAFAMAFELGAYGAISGYLYREKSKNVYVSLISAMLVGRLLSGCINALLLGFFGNGYSLSIYLTGTFIEPIAGIAIQIIFIPVIVKLLDKRVFGQTVNS